MIVIRAFETDSIDPIKDFSKRDDTVDALWHSVFREMLTFMMENPRRSPGEPTISWSHDISNGQETMPVKWQKTSTTW